MRKKCFAFGFLAILILIAAPLSVMAQEHEEAGLADGVYEGRNSMMDVSVTIEEGRIADIEILEHRAGEEKYKDMIVPLVDAIIEKQSTGVDAITGATTSSEALKIAVEEALEKSRLSSEKKALIEKYTTGSE